MICCRFHVLKSRWSCPIIREIPAGELFLRVLPMREINHPRPTEAVANKKPEASLTSRDPKPDPPRDKDWNEESKSVSSFTRGQMWHCYWIPATVIPRIFRWSLTQLFKFFLTRFSSSLNELGSPSILAYVNTTWRGLKEIGHHLAGGDWPFV